jgi:hypothetical protein
MIDAIKRISMIQKKIPNTTAAPSSVSFSSFFVTGAGNGGINAKIKKEKKIDTRNNGAQAIPQPTGPKGVIHNCPDQVARKIIRKKTHRPLKGLFENMEMINIINNVTRKAAGII